MGMRPRRSKRGTIRSSASGSSRSSGSASLASVTDRSPSSNPSFSASARRSEVRARSTGRVSIDRSCWRQSTTPVQLREARCSVASLSSGSAERTEASAALKAATARADWSRCSW